MKIEKLNDNQIRCTLTHADLADRQIKISELVCGGEKAKSLFHDMMQKAHSEFGFEAEDTPLMIEAVPASSDSIVLIITKCDDPEDLENKFSKHHVLDKLEGADDIINLLNKVKDAVVKKVEEDATQIQKKEEPKGPKIRLFSFSTLDCVIQASRLLADMYQGANTLYKDTPNDIYVLAMAQSEHSLSEFNKVCNMLSEYGCMEKSSPAVLAYLEEHCEAIVCECAVQQLSTI